MKLKEMVFVRQSTVKRAYAEWEFHYPLSKEQVDKILEEIRKDNPELGEDIEIEYFPAKVTCKKYATKNL